MGSRLLQSRDIEDLLITLLSGLRADTYRHKEILPAKCPTYPL